MGSKQQTDLGLVAKLASQGLFAPRSLSPDANPRRLRNSVDACSRSSASRDGCGAPALRADRHGLGAGTLE